MFVHVTVFDVLSLLPLYGSKAVAPDPPGPGSPVELKRWHLTPLVMAPKAQPKPQAAAQPKAKAKPKPAAAPAPAAAAAAQQRDGINASHNSTVLDAINSILAHALFTDMETAATPARGQREPTSGMVSYKDSYDPAMVEANLDASGRSECACNFFAQDTLRSPVPGVPVNTKAVQLLMSRDFGVPCEFPERIRVAVPSANELVTASRWTHFSPDEMLHAYVMAVARDVNDPTTPRDTLLKWRFYLLTCTFAFEVKASPDDIAWAATRLREDAAVRFFRSEWVPPVLGQH